MTDWLKRLHSWAGRKLYGSSWPPMLILVLRPKEFQACEGRDCVQCAANLPLDLLPVHYWPKESGVAH